MATKQPNILILWGRDVGYWKVWVKDCAWPVWFAQPSLSTNTVHFDPSGLQITV